MKSGADVQIELGNWSRVHNIIFEQLAKADLSGREAKCLFFLLRMTYGNQCKEHEISLSLWATGTGIDKRHVKTVIDRLMERRIVYRIDGKRGRGNTAIYGFNKYFEQWDNAEKVLPTAPIKKVPPVVPILEEKVPPVVPEKVPPVVPITERKQQAAADDVIALIRLAYDSLGVFPPKMDSDSWRNSLKVSMQLIDAHGYPMCAAMIPELKARHIGMVKNNKRGITSPMQYLRTMMDDAAPVAVQPTTVLTFSLEDVL